MDNDDKMMLHQFFVVLQSRFDVVRCLAFTCLKEKMWKVIISYDNIIIESERGSPLFIL
jgi:hypothetical protein